MPDVNMRKPSAMMEEGTAVEWKKKSGEEVKTGAVLAKVESDKPTFDLEAEADGTLQILVEQGVPAKIGAPIAKIGEGEAAPAPKAKPKEPETPPTVAEEREPAPKSAPPKQASPEKPKPEQSPDGQRDEVKASPLARRLAEEMGVDLASLKGSGPEGRIVKEDVVAAGGGRQKSDRRRPMPTTERAAGPHAEVVEPNPTHAATPLPLARIEIH